MASSSHSTVTVNLAGRSYCIHIGANLLDQLGPLVRARCAATRAAVITDSNVGPQYADRAVTSLAAAGFAATLMTIPAGEASKSLAIAAELYDALAEGRHRRDEPIIALGGGVVGDVAGFVAATWLRGAPLVQCPTTLEADVDASVGGKTAVNISGGKNLVGAFHQPILVCIDPACLATLGQRDYRAGLAESVKHAVVADAAFLDWHEQSAADILARDAAKLAELVRRNCEIKAAVVVADERETLAMQMGGCSAPADGSAPDSGATGVGRAALNFGHTIGHALESASAYALRHGEAVALGMVAALDLAVRATGFPAGLRDRIESLLDILGLPTRLDQPVPACAVLDAMTADKKAAAGLVRFVLPTAPGVMTWATPGQAEIAAALNRIGCR